jgi:hypothetical protein
MHLHAGRFVLAAVVAAAFVLGAPFIAVLRSQLRAAFPGQYVRLLGAVVALAIGGAVVAALARIRERRQLRYGAIAAALAMGVGYAVRFRTGNPAVDAVERFHFVEYGLVTLLFYRAWRPLNDGSIFVLPVLAGLLVGTLEEWFQWFIPARVGEAGDVFMNLVAISCGMLFAIAVDPPERFGLGLRRGSGARIAAAASAVVVVFAAFFYTLHLGHDVRDPEIGTFDSRFTGARLLELSAERAARWRSRPPIELRRLSREDQYFSEGVEHVERRNDAWGEGDIAAAWAENRILEKYYEPVLDTPSYVSKTGFRWPAEQRADAARRAAGGRAGEYVSDAYPYRLYKWPPGIYWAAAAVVAAALAWPALRGRRAP